MRAFLNVAEGVAWRQIRLFIGNPAFLLPSIIFPLFFFTSFAGGMSALGDIPGFDFPSGYTAFVFAFVLLQSAAFGGIFTGFSIAADFESGFSRRLFLAAPDRRAIIAGYAAAATFRALCTWALLTTVALLTGLQIDGGPVDIVGLYTLAILVNITALLFACGVAMRLRTMQAGPAMQMPMFFLLFLAPVYVPRDLLEGWIHGAASVNPLTPLLELARDLISGGSVHAWAFAVIAGMFVLLTVWALRGLRSAETAG